MERVHRRCAETGLGVMRVEAESPALPRPGEAQAQGTLVGAPESWKSAFRDDGPFWVGRKNVRKESHHNLPFWRSSTVVRRKKRHSKGSAVVTPRESGSALGFVFQVKDSEHKQFLVRVGRCCGGEAGWMSPGCRENGSGMGQDRTTCGETSKGTDRAGRP